MMSMLPLLLWLEASPFWNIVLLENRVVKEITFLADADASSLKNVVVVSPDS